MDKWIVFVVFAAVLVILVLVAFWLRKKGYMDEVYGMLYALVCRAETYFEGNGRGAEKKAWVVDRIHEALPGWAQIFVSEQDIDRLIERAVEMMKEYLAQQSAS